MNQRFVIGISIVALLLVAGFFFLNKNDNAKFEWRDDLHRNGYKETNNQPYGTQTFHNLMANYPPGRKRIDLNDPLAQSLPIDTNGHSNYVFIGGGMYLDSASTEQLRTFVEAGNTALIISKTIPFDLMFHIYYEECEDAAWDDYEHFSDSVITLQMASNPEARALIKYAIQNKAKPSDWHYIDDRYFCSELSHQALGFYKDSLVNFAEFPCGKGRFLLHTTPMAFTNYHLLRSDARTYAASVLAYLQDGNVYWDAHSRVPESVTRRRNQRNGNGGEDSNSDKLLTYMLKQPALAWAWYLLLGMALAYTLFRAKRRQRIVPVLPKNENSSYEFISTIAHLHFKEQHYQSMSMQGIKLFLAQVRERYGVHILMDDTYRLRIDPAQYQRLIQLSEVPEAQIQQLFQQYDDCVRFQPIESMMVAFHLALEQFWKKAR
jgi:hypothetical protein